MITHKDQVEVLVSKQYGLNAFELNRQAKEDRELLELINEKYKLDTKAKYLEWLNEMEELGSKGEKS